ncbi:DNRLRE domain-containing protein [Kineobactrum salinum]|uniref:DNRLRE domain-containing protein n=1 Tax=Kineobactrum salinum TaxID=2708301 RepID=A0A6C0TXY6_9GAMM|nr:DNRLRE domain-containing protein [Kineobactrum salinum]QIB64692.1 DNRLRE domain-containing protein [Kineobactrum salinum]
MAAPRALSDGPKGVTCANYSLAGRLGWQQKLGDWVDQEGVMHGPAPVATARLGNTALSAGLQLDITSLARDWLNGSRPNTGVLLRSRGGQGIVRFDSRETDTGTAPVLELEWRGRPATQHAP